MTLAQCRPGRGFPGRGVLRLTGSIFDEPAPEPAAELLDALRRFRADQATIAQLAAALRGTALYVAVSDEDGRFALPTGRDGELSWLGVFTSPGRMAEFYRAAGRGADNVRYGELTGAELIDQCLPALPRSTGLVLDPGSEHGTALAPIRGLVPDEIALTEGGK
ncbi:SseB family protein [Saccharopolyspora elongata]|uniref:SseB family protein n=1 Tax=Saccharopolyspora elongata TaxID=2530387 RepID=A0A4R4Z1Z6_9PSEU|nr:SseB family protein [Saccharopolyspora elongata]TDD51968.1 SseB family protein [Saccharopolyspora elongata]